MLPYLDNIATKLDTLEKPVRCRIAVLCADRFTHPWIPRIGLFQRYRPVVETFLDSRIGSSSWSEQNRFEICSLSRQSPGTINSGTSQWKSPNLSELCTLSAGCLAGPPVDLYNALAFDVWEYYLIKIACSASNNHILHALQIAISIILKSVLLLLYLVLLTTNVVNSSVMSSSICIMPWLPNMPDQTLLTLCWYSFSWWGNEDSVHWFGCKGRHYMLYELLPQSDSHIAQGTRPRIVDAPLTLIFRMGQGVCRLWFGC